MPDTSGYVSEEVTEIEYVTLADPGKGRSGGYLFSTLAGNPTLPKDCPVNTLALDLKTKKLYHYFVDDEGYYMWSLVGGSEVYQSGTVDDSSSSGGDDDGK